MNGQTNKHTYCSTLHRRQGEVVSVMGVNRANEMHD